MRLDIFYNNNYIEYEGISDKENITNRTISPNA